MKKISHLVLAGILEERSEPLLLEREHRLPEVRCVLVRPRPWQLVAAGGLVVPELLQGLASPLDDEVQRVAEALLGDLVGGARFGYRLAVLEMMKKCRYVRKAKINKID